MIKSSFASGLLFVDTKDLDGETNLKEKMVNSEFNKMDEKSLFSMEGTIQCDLPNEYMDFWDANIFVKSHKFFTNSTIKQLLLKGSILRNTEHAIGIVIYNGHNTKIMKNAKNPPIKMSNVMRTMNSLLVSVFIFQIIICIFFSIANLIFREENNKFIGIYIIINQDITIKSVVVKFFTFLVAYSHLIPISLYVAMEVVKLLQSLFLFYDDLMMDLITMRPAVAKTSELIEELGQVEFVFSDKTGTLTQNHMEFKKCFVNGKIYGGNWDEDTRKLKILQKSSYDINGDETAYRILADEYADDFDSNKKHLTNFFRIASVCHSAIAEKDRITGQLKYSSSSPDEVALIKGAKKIGFTFLERTTDKIEMMNVYTKKSENYEILLEIPFDSDRKRMTIVVKEKEDFHNTVYIFTKGADNIMLPRINIDLASRESADGNLKKF